MTKLLQGSRHKWAASCGWPGYCPSVWRAAGGLMTTSTVGEALDRLCAVQVSEEDDADCPDELFDRVDDLIDAYGADDVAEIVAEAVEAGQASVEQAIVFLNVAAWSGTDNGASMKSTLDEWVRKADDAVRLGIALHHECYPLPTRAEMIAKLGEIARRFPEYRAICERHIADR
ncbi:hypothetical protein ACFXB4_00820 [Streptomyces lavendulae]|uniref:hypothetical protein n=1 Tax=Streptomyces lavendulae TaxID=1914 RepID=UPI003695D0AF